MSSVYWKNLIGGRCTDFELLQIPHPKLELTVHVSLKSVQMGVLLGSLYGLGEHFIRGTDAKGALKRSVVSGGMAGALLGAIFGPAMALGRISKLQTWQIYDRCYRLRHNQVQLNTDRAAIIGAIVGYASGGCPGFVFGVDMATVAGLLSYALFANKKSFREFM